MVNKERKGVFYAEEKEYLGKQSIISTYYKKVADIQQLIHNRIPKFSAQDEKCIRYEFREEYYNGANYKRVVIYLMSNGCEWALKSGNGCTMCGHVAKQTRGDRISAEYYISEFDKLYKSLNFSDYPIVSLFNNGSFINDNEIECQAQEYILKKLNDNKDILVVIIETRPEFVNDKKIERIKNILSDKHLEIAMGLEIKDDDYRKYFLNKGFSLARFEFAANIICKYAHLRTYVLLKPPFLNEKESIDNAIKTIEYAFEVGSTTVSLEACTIQAYTLIEELFENGLYTPPYLWSIIDVLKNVRNKKKLLVGMFQFYPLPHRVPYNCDKCSVAIVNKIKEYNRTMNEDVFDGLDCECKKKWYVELEEAPKSIEYKLAEFYEALTKILNNNCKSERQK